MKIANIEITKEKAILLTAGIVILITIALDTAFYLPTLGKLKNRYMECRNCENDVSGSRSLIESTGKNLGEMTLMTEKDVPLAIEELTKHGKANGVSFVSMQPGEVTPDKSSSYKILPIEINLEAGEKQIAAFLGTLDELKKSLIKVRAFDVTPEKEDRTRLRASITLEIYLSAKEYPE